MEETGVKSGVIVTYEDEGEIKEGGKKVSIIPAYKFLLNVNSDEFVTSQN
jgi:predicted AAA+ superfamily ATPase